MTGRGSKREISEKALQRRDPADQGAIFGVSRQEVVDRLRAAGCVFAEEEAGLIADAARTPDELDAFTARRVGGEPLEYVLGWAEFCGLRIRVEPGVFVPRQRTAFLVERAIALIPGSEHPVVVDLCCGSGAIGAALAHRLPRIALSATDIDQASVRCARTNIVGNVFQGDLYDALPGSLRGAVDLLVANAPYVPTGSIATMPREARLHEARASLDGGLDGLDLHRRIAATASAWLRPGGHLLIETSDEQADRTAGILALAGLTVTVAHSDEFDATVVTGARA